MGNKAREEREVQLSIVKTTSAARTKKPYVVPANKRGGRLPWPKRFELKVARQKEERAKLMVKVNKKKNRCIVGAQYVPEKLLNLSTLSNPKVAVLGFARGRSDR